MLKFYRIFCIAWKFLAKFVEWCLKKLYYTAFFSKIFWQDFSARFFGKIFRYYSTTNDNIFCIAWLSLAKIVMKCRIMTKNAVESLFYSFFRYYSTKKLVSKNNGERCLSKDVKFLVCRMMMKNEVDDVYKKLFRITWLITRIDIQYKYNKIYKRK